MTIRKRDVAVIQLPEIKNAKQRQAFLRDMQSSIGAERPFVVLDCSSAGQFDRSGVDVLLCCLEEAMKRNGDVKLAGLHVASEAALGSCGANRLFDIHDTAANAVNSFHKRATTETSQASRSKPESAA